MFCALVKKFAITDHYVLQISSVDLSKVVILKDGLPLNIENYKTSFVIYGGFDPGYYEIICKDKIYSEYFIVKEGQEVE